MLKSFIIIQKAIVSNVPQVTRASKNKSNVHIIMIVVIILYTSRFVRIMRKAKPNSHKDKAEEMWIIEIEKDEGMSETLNYSRSILQMEPNATKQYGKCKGNRYLPDGSPTGESCILADRLLEFSRTTWLNAAVTTYIRPGSNSTSLKG